MNAMAPAQGTYYYRGEFYCTECVECESPCLGESERANLLRGTGIGSCACCKRLFAPDYPKISRSEITEAVKFAFENSLTASGWHLVRVYSDGSIHVIHETKKAGSTTQRTISNDPYTAIVWETETASPVATKDEASRQAESINEEWLAANVGDFSRKLKPCGGLELID